MNNYLRTIKYFFHTRTSGLEDFVDDVRDLHISELFGATPYVRQAVKKWLGPIFEKDQLRLEICSFETASRALAIYFGEDVSQRWLAAKAWKEGYCDRNGTAQLRNWCKIAQKYGVILEKDFPSNDSLPWGEYVSIDFHNLEPLAEKTKIGSYWRVDTTDEYLRCIDEGYAVALGREWRSSYNQGGGFSKPWIINSFLRSIGFVVGGHATAGIGYDFSQYPKGLSIEQNSYSNKWGDNGQFYCELEGLQKDIDLYGAYAITKVAYTPKDKKISLLEQILSLTKELLNLKKKV